MKVCVIGRGKVGRALHRALSQSGVDVTLTRGRPPLRASALAGADVYVLATPDGALAALSRLLAPMLPAGATALHCAGARGPEELAPLSARGLSVGVLHPLISFAGAKARVDLRGATFTTFGDRRAVAASRKLVKRLDARCTVIAAPGPAYHAAAALVANGASALADLGARILVQLGFEQRAAERAIAALLASVASNAATTGLPRALTGPVVRGDVGTVTQHLAALGQLDPALRAAYAALQPLVIESAQRAGLAPDRARALRRALRKPRRRAQVR